MHPCCMQCVWRLKGVQHRWYTSDMQQTFAQSSKRVRFRLLSRTSHLCTSSVPRPLFRPPLRASLFLAPWAASADPYVSESLLSLYPPRHDLLVGCQPRVVPRHALIVLIYDRLVCTFPPQPTVRHRVTFRLRKGDRVRYGAKNL